MSEKAAPLLFTNDTEESAQAMRQLADNQIPFVPLPSEGAAPVLLTHDERTYNGLTAITEYIEEQLTTRQ